MDSMFSLSSLPCSITHQRSSKLHLFLDTPFSSSTISPSSASSFMNLLLTTPSSKHTYTKDLSTRFTVFLSMLRNFQVMKTPCDSQILISNPDLTLELWMHRVIHKVTCHSFIKYIYTHRGPTTCLTSKT